MRISKPDMHFEASLARTTALNNFGLKVIRFTNHQITNDIGRVLTKILKTITEDTPLHGGRGAAR